MKSNTGKGLIFSIILAAIMMFSLVQPATANNVDMPTEQGNGPTTPLHPVVSQSLYNITTAPLREIMETYEPPKGDGVFRVVPNKPMVGGKFGIESGDRSNDSSKIDGASITNTTGFIDPHLPAPSASSSPVQTVRSFDGFNIWDDAATLGYGVAPPDTDGAVGPDHYVQMINTVWGVFDKNTGEVIGGPFPNNIFWDAADTGDACEANNDGDPIVLYDEEADRWLLSQFAVGSGDGEAGQNPYYECIAISASPDPLGAWNLYSFAISDTKMNDYPHLGIWSDGYYMSFNQFTGGASWGGQGVAAFERDEMLLGNPATFIYYDLYPVNPDLGGMLPSNIEGNAAPPAGTPNYFVEMDDDAWGWPTDQLQFWAFHVDWVTPANSSFTYQNTLTTDPFDTDLCGYSRECIEQPGTDQKVDAIPDRLMYSLQYRNFGTHQSMVVNHTVDVGGDQAGVRWYELRRTTGDWSIYQQGDYAPDGDNRWMGSASMDNLGNIALGYSVSSATTYPSVHYTGRLEADPLGVMTLGENAIVEGGGSQLGVSRWGDYSMMDVDPADDCTFWYTQEYVADTGQWNWATRIGSFKLPGCGPVWGTLSGTITDDSTTLPVEGAKVAITGGVTAYTDASGDYLFDGLPAGNYDVTVTSYWYEDGVVHNVAVVDGTAATQDLALRPRGVDTISGTVYDNSGQGWPLYAYIEIPELHDDNQNPLAYRVLYTDPETGAYSVDLAEGREHTFITNAFSGGYEEVAQSFTASGSGTLDIPLEIDVVACDAPGYYYDEGFGEDFEGGVPSGSWSTVDNIPAGTFWAESSFWGDANYTGGTGDAAESSSDAWGPDYYDTELVSPVIATASLPANPTLTYLANFQNYAGRDNFDVDINVDGGGWVNLLSWNEDHGGFFAAPGEAVALDLTTALAGSTDFQLSWRYYDLGQEEDPWYWYVQIDDVSIGACVPTAGLDNLVVGTVEDMNGQPALGASVSTGSETVYTKTIQEGPEYGTAFYFLPAPSGTQNVTARALTSTTASVVVPSSTNIRHDFALEEANLSFIGDFDGDGADDMAIFRPSDSTWYIHGIGSFVYGEAGDIPVPGDYDGDGKTDIAIFRASNHTWYIRGVGPFVYGDPGDIPVPADYDGDGATDIAVFRSSNHTWYIYGVGPFVYGDPDDIPVPADYNGDGKDDIAIFRPSNHTWYIYGVGPFVYGDPGDIPVPADYDGNGTADIAVFRPSTHTWYTYGAGTFAYGNPADIPVPADYNGDGMDEVAVFRPSNGTWYIYGLGAYAFGTDGDIPVSPDLLPGEMP